MTANTAMKPMHSARVWLLALCALLVLGCKPVSGQSDHQPGMLTYPLPVAAIHHYGRGHHIGEFQIDGRSCGNAGRPEGNSGSDTMCSVFVPEVWRPGIKKKVKWNVTNWTADLEGLQPGNSGRWVEGEAELERYTASSGGLEVHFFPGDVLRLVPNAYGPPDSDTDPKQTPPLAELPVDEPRWDGIGECMAALQYEGRCKEGVAEGEKDADKYLAFLERVWRSRGGSDAQVQGVLEKVQEERGRGIRSGYLNLLSRNLERLGMKSSVAYKESERYRYASQQELDAEIIKQLQAVQQQKKGR